MTRRIGLVTACVVVAAAAVWAAWAVVQASQVPGSWLGAGSAAGVEALAPHDALPVRLLRGGLGRVTIPFLLVVATAAAVVLVRQRRWRALLAGCLVMGGGNLTVQAVKRGVVPFGTASPPVLSGHMAVVVGTAVLLWLAVPVRYRRATAWGGVLGVAATGVGVVLTAWHTPAQVLAATALAGAWLALAWPLLGAEATAQPVQAPAGDRGPENPGSDPERVRPPA